MLEKIGRLFPKENLNKIRLFLEAGGFKVSAEEFLGRFIIVSLIFSLLVSFLLYFTPEYFSIFAEITNVENNVILFLVLFLLFFVCSVIGLGMIFFAYGSLRNEKRKMNVENVLPDFLMLIAANVKTGMTLDQAIWYAAKPEFGLLSTETKEIIKSAFSGEPLENALERLGKRFDSRILKRTINLLKQALVSGGEVADILERTANDARDAQIVKKDIAASLLMYEIFVVFSAVIGAPFLFSVAARLIMMIEKTFQYIPVGVESAEYGFGGIATPLVTSSEFIIFTLGVLFLTSFFSSLIIGSIRTGSKNQGIMYFPLILALSYIVYFVVDKVLEGFFANMLI